MPDERAMESDDVFRFDVQTAAYRTRTLSALSNYRGISRPSNFIPPASDPGDDPPQPSESADTPSMESNAVGYYDGLSSSHRTKVSTELENFASELRAYARDYKRRTGEDYIIPESSVPDLSVIDDENDSRLESNTVSDYDAAIPGYSFISSESKDSFDSYEGEYQTNLTKANNKLDALNGTGANSVYKKMKDLTALIHNINE